MGSRVLPECFFPGFGKKIRLDTASEDELAEFVAYCKQTDTYVHLFGELVSEFESQVMPGLSRDIQVYRLKREGLVGEDARACEQVLESQIIHALGVARSIWRRMCDERGLDPRDVTEVSHRCLEQALAWNGLARSFHE